MQSRFLKLVEPIENPSTLKVKQTGKAGSMSHPTNKHQRLEMGRNKARKIIKAWRGWWGHKEWLSEDGKIFKTLVHTRKPCSCHMCGNPRRYFGEVTKQERIADIEFEEQLNS